MLKSVLKMIYGKVPAQLLRKSPLKTYMHHKAIPSGVDSFYVGATRVIIKADQSPLVRKLYWLGLEGYEQDELILFDHFCRNSNRVVEIGGNIGYFTIFGARHASIKEYVVVEPLPYNFGLLTKNIELNGLENVRALQAAVTGEIEPKQIRFFVPKDEKYEAATGGYIEGAEAINREFSKEIMVDTLPSFLLLENVDLLKIDAEGSEFEILSGATTQIIKYTPIILVEMRRNTHKLREWVQQLMQLNSYQALVMSGRTRNIERIEPSQIKSISLQDTFDTRDLILCPTEKLNLIPVGRLKLDP